MCRPAPAAAGPTTEPAWSLEKRAAEARAAQRRASAAERQAESASWRCTAYAAAVYQQGGGLGDLEAYLSSQGPQELLDRAASLEAVGAARNRTLQRASATSVVADTMRRQAALAQGQQLAAAQRAEKARADAQAQAESVAAATAQIRREQQTMAAELASLRNTTVSLERRRQDGLRAAAEARAAAAAAAKQARLAVARAQAARTAAAKRAAQQAAARARAEAARQAAAALPRTPPAAPPRRGHPGARGGLEPADAHAAPPPPSTRGGVSAVLAYARAQIGKPYQWGGEGPNAYDCSGLTMMAWRQAGVYLSHYTGAQWRETARVAISDLRPGDLVFYGPSGETSHHMGPYIGGGRMIEAPHTGATIREASIYRATCCPTADGCADAEPHGIQHGSFATTKPARLLSSAGFVVQPSVSRLSRAAGGPWWPARRSPSRRHSASSGLCATGGLASWPSGMCQRAVDMPASLARVMASSTQRWASARPSQCAPRPTCPARGPCRSRRSAGSRGGRTR